MEGPRDGGLRVWHRDSRATGRGTCAKKCLDLRALNGFPNPYTGNHVGQTRVRTPSRTKGVGRGSWVPGYGSRGYGSRGTGYGARRTGRRPVVPDVGGIPERPDRKVAGGPRRWTIAPTVKRVPEMWH